jgi:hypothetical protein
MQPLNCVVTAEGTLPRYISEECKCIVAKLAGKHIKIKIWEAGDNLTNPQRRFYRGRVLPHVRTMMHEAGDVRSEDAWHEVLLEEFAPRKEVKLVSGAVVTRPKRSGNGEEDMTKAEMIDYITAILAECAMRNDPVPTKGYEDWKK